MAVSEEESSSGGSNYNRSRSAASPNGACYLAKCVLRGSVVLQVLHGHIRSPSSNDVVFGKILCFFRQRGKKNLPSWRYILDIAAPLAWGCAAPILYIYGCGESCWLRYGDILARRTKVDPKGCEVTEFNTSIFTLFLE